MSSFLFEWNGKHFQESVKYLLTTGVKRFAQLRDTSCQPFVKNILHQSIVAFCTKLFLLSIVLIITRRRSEGIIIADSFRVSLFTEFSDI